MFVLMQNKTSNTTPKKTKVRKAVLTDAGYATRFLPISKTLPKSMLPIVDKPIMQHIIEEVMEAGITEVIIVATKEGKPIYEDYFHNTVQHIYKKLEEANKKDRFNKVRDVFSLPNIIVITQDPKLPYGTAAPALSARPYIGDEPFLYLFTDDLIIGKSASLELVNRYNISTDDTKAILATKYLPDCDVSKYGIYVLKDGTKDEVAYSMEKPQPEETDSRWINFGRYLFTSKIFDYIEPTDENRGLDGELWINDGIARMAKENKVILKDIEGNWMTTGDPMNYLKTIITLAKEDETFANWLKALSAN